MDEGNRNQTADVVRLLLELQQRGRITTSEAADLLGCDRRLARRRLASLAEYAPVAHHGEGRARSWVLDPIQGQARLGIYDRIALRVGRDATSFLDGTPLEATLDRATDPEAAEPRYAPNLARKIRVKQEPAWISADRRDHLDDLLDGLLREHTLTLTYAARTGPREWEAFVPLSLVAYRRVLYLLGRRSIDDPGPVRRLRVDRILSVKAGPPFVYPADWDPDAELDKGFGILASGEPETIVLEFVPEAESLVRERLWHPTQRLEALPGGGVRLVMVTGGFELTRFVLEWGRLCRVISPAWLRDAVVDELRDALAAYDPDRT